MKIGLFYLCVVELYHFYGKGTFQKMQVDANLWLDTVFMK